MANPRVDDLRKRLDREPGSRLFGQLAEELRKDGELTEAIRVARTGLAAHPNYPSARMTLGRALFDSGELAAARGELEHVLRGAPDNILASRMLAECLEGLGDFGAALLQFRAALRLAPGDRQAEVQIKALEQRLAGGGGARPGPASAPPSPAASQARVAFPRLPVAVASPPSGARSPISVAPQAASRSSASSDPPADFDDVFETAPSWQRRPTASARPEGEAILLLENEAPALPGSPLVSLGPAAPPAPVEARRFDPPLPSVVAAPGPEAALPPPRPEALAHAAPTPGSSALLAPSAAAVAPLVAEPSAPASVGERTAEFAAFSVILPPPEATPEPSFLPPVAPAAAEEPAPALTAGASVEAHPEAAALSTSTLAELYFDQGFPDKSVQVYEELLEREPQNGRARARLIEIKAMSRPLLQDALPDPRGERRRGLERKIARLEEMLAAVRRG